MLPRPVDATVAQVADVTRWANHTVRGSFAGMQKGGIEFSMLERVR
jgi:hypothetical protein